VPEDQPRVIKVPSANITARVKSVGLTSTSKIDVPSDLSFAGWYEGSAKIGKNGAAFITGHYNWHTGNAVFDFLDKVKKNDLVMVERGDGKEYTYKIFQTETIPASQVDMASLLENSEGRHEELNIMTCAGQMSGGSATHRLIVRTERVK
jgi:LPXTG-site transpeptidase (sortase) family protein